MCWNTAVRRGRRLRTDLAFRAGLVLDHHRLASELAHLVGDHARHGVSRRTGPNAGDDADKSCAATGSATTGSASDTAIPASKPSISATLRQASRR
jgi:hypothetical protein